MAPTINIFLYLIENLLSMNFVLKLSDPSTIISKFLIILFKFLFGSFVIRKIESLAFFKWGC